MDTCNFILVYTIFIQLFFFVIFCFPFIFMLPYIVTNKKKGEGSEALTEYFRCISHVLFKAISIKKLACLLGQDTQ